MGSQPSALSSNRQLQGLVVTKQQSARRKQTLNKKFSDSDILTIIDFDVQDFFRNGKSVVRRPLSSTFPSRTVTLDSKSQQPKPAIKVVSGFHPVKNKVSDLNDKTEMEGKEKGGGEMAHLDQWVHKNEPYLENTDIHPEEKKIDKQSTLDQKKDEEEAIPEEVPDVTPEETYLKDKAEKLEKVKVNLEKFAQHKNDRAEDGQYSDELRGDILAIYNSYFSMKKYGLKRRHVYYKELIDILLESEHKIIEEFCRLSKELLERGYRGESGKPVGGFFKPLRNMLAFLQNLTDKLVPELGERILDQSELIDTLIRKLGIWVEFETMGELKENDRILLRVALGLFNNLSQLDECTVKLRKLGIVKTIAPLLDSHADIIKFVTLSILANIVDEKESQILHSKAELIQFCLKCLRKAMDKKIRRFNGWTVREIARTLRMASKNDNNKRMVYTHGAVPLLVELANNFHSEDEQKEAVETIWTLSFDKENQADMVRDQETGVIDTLINLSKTAENNEVRRICKNALFTMKDILKTSERYKSVVTEAITEDFDKLKTPRGDLRETHVMLSYNWGNQNIIKDICLNLRNNGIRVWMDVDDLHGSTLQAMANAVEKADIVLVCYSNKYKNSDNCRAEAEYAYQLKKKIIPLRMEKGYQGDGWLGLIIGAKLFYDFSGKYPFEAKMDELVREVKQVLNTMSGVIEEVPEIKITNPSVVTVKPVASAPPQSVGAPTDANVQKVKKWTPQHVGKWLDKNNLPRNLLGRLSGVEVAFLHVLVHESPDVFYKTIGEQLAVKDILTMAKLRFALESFDINI